MLQKIAEIENIDIEEEDLDEEIERVAVQSNESPRRVRARLEKDDLMDVLATELIERAALDLILDNAEYEDVPIGKWKAPWPRSNNKRCPARCTIRPLCASEAEAEKPATEEKRPQES